MAYLATANLIVQDVLNRAGELTALTGTTSDYLAQTKQFVQRSYYDVLLYAPWPWALKDPPGVISMVAKSTGTATFTLGSANITASAIITGSKVGYWMWLDNEQIPYRIITHTTGTAAIVLDAVYTSATITGAYSIFKDEYSLASDCLRIWRAWLRDDSSRVIDVITEAEMASRYPARNIGTYPRRVALVRGDKLRIVPWPETTPLTLEYEYTIKPSADFTFDGVAGTDTPVLPITDRHVLSDFALSLLLHLKNDSRAGEMIAAVTSKLGTMSKLYLPIGKSRLYILPGQGVWNG